MRERARWRNWAGNQVCAPHAILRPATESEIVAIVQRAVEAGRRVKCVGAGHSFTGVACTDGDLLDLSGYGRVLHVDRAAGLATVQAGIPLHRLNRELAAHGLALENLGDIAYQSIAGAISTATHGTGARFRNLSAGVVAMRLIDGTGRVHDVSPDGEAADLLDIAPVGIGALGIVSTVTLRCVRAFNLHAVERAERVDELLERFDEECDTSDHFEFFWVPNTRWALTKRNRRTDEPVRPLPTWRRLRDDVLYDNVAFGALQKVARWRNDLVPDVARRLPSSGAREYVDVSYEVFASPRMVRFHEMEYAVPRQHGVEALRRVQDLVDRLGYYVGFPVEVRVTAADDLALSTAHGRDTVYIACHVHPGVPQDAYFRGVESIMDDYGGRPHWGKLHFQTAETLAPRYPRWADFQSARARLDPDGRFANPELDRVLGPIGV